MAEGGVDVKTSDLPEEDGILVVQDDGKYRVYHGKLDKGQVSTGQSMVRMVKLPDKDEEDAIFYVDKFKEIFKDCTDDTPLLAIALTGMFRSGKSFLVNLFITYFKYITEHGNDIDWETSELPITGVDWAGGNKAVTSGVLMWDKPIMITKKNGKQVAIIFTDIQGLEDSLHTDAKIDNLIMYIGLQICNVQILNLYKNIGLNNIYSVKLVTTYASANDETQKLFGHLIYLARDHPGDDLGSQEEVFEEIAKESQSEDVRSASKGIKDAFKSVTCFHLPEPCPSLKTANGSDCSTKVCEADVGKSFLEHCKALFRMIERKKIDEQFTVGSAIEGFQDLEARIKGHTTALSDPMQSFLDILAYRQSKEIVTWFKTQMTKLVEHADSFTSEAEYEVAIRKVISESKHKFLTQLSKSLMDAKGLKIYSQYETTLGQKLEELMDVKLNSFRDKIKIREQKQIAEVEKEKARAAEDKLKEVEKEKARAVDELAKVEKEKARAADERLREIANIERLCRKGYQAEVSSFVNATRERVQKALSGGFLNFFHRGAVNNAEAAFNHAELSGDDTEILDIGSVDNTEEAFDDVDL